LRKAENRHRSKSSERAPEREPRRKQDAAEEGNEGSCGGGGKNFDVWPVLFL